jgi:hypothetical protein
MKKKKISSKVLSFILSLVLVLGMIPSPVFAIDINSNDMLLCVGNTIAYREERYFDNRINSINDNNEPTYWKAAASGEDAYEKTGTADDYLFSVYLDNENQYFILTLNGVDITSSYNYIYNDYGDSGIFTNYDLMIILANNTTNSIKISGSDIEKSSGIYAKENLAIRGDGSLSISGGECGIYVENSVIINDATINSSGIIFGIWSDSNVIINRGTVNASGTGENSQGICAGDFIGINEANVTAIGSLKALAPYNNPRRKMNIINTDYSDVENIDIQTNFYKYRTNTTIGEPTSDYTLFEYENTEFINNVDFKYVEIIYTPPVLIGGETENNETAYVSSINDKGNVSYWLNDGNGSLTTTGASIQSYNVKYNELTRTLTLKDAVITSFNPGIRKRDIKNIVEQNNVSPQAMFSNDFGIFALSNLNIILDGENIIGTNDKPAKHGIVCEGELTINSDTLGSLSIVSEGVKSTGIIACNKASINGVRINIEGGTHGIVLDRSRDINTLSLDNCVIKLMSEEGAILFYETVPSLSLPANYKYKSNIVALEPDDDYIFGDYTYSEYDKYLEIISTYDITKASVTNGSFTASSSSTEAAIAAIGDIVELEATPNSGYNFSSWDVYKTGDINTKVRESNIFFVMPAYPVTVSASFTMIINQAPAKTISVTDSSSSLFNNSLGSIIAQANMTNAFSNSVEVKVTDTDESAANFGLGIGNTVYPFDISLYTKGTNDKAAPKDGYAVTISLPIPEKLLDIKEQIKIAHKAADGTVSILKSELKQIKGVWYLVFETNEFSPYALVVSSTGTYNPDLGVPYYLDSSEKEMFIGFAANGKYLTPQGAKVLLKNNAKAFTDIDSHWAKSNINFVTERELFLGTGGTEFSPNSNMTRAMFATVIGRLYERSFGNIELSETQAFTDCNYNEYYGKYVDWASENGILKGYGNGVFKPNALVSREEMATVIYRFADFLKVVDNNVNTELSYTDSASISSWAVDAALYSQSTGLITGRVSGNFVPQGTATRAEVSVILERFIHNILN